MQITGHRNANYVSNYSSLLDKQQKKISGILSFTGPSDKREPLASISTTTTVATDEYCCNRRPQGLQMPLTGLGSLIMGTIAGGTFNNNVNLQQNTSKETESTLESCKKWKHVKRVVESDESQDLSEWLLAEFRLWTL